MEWSEPGLGLPFGKELTTSLVKLYIQEELGCGSEFLMWMLVPKSRARD